MKKIIFSQKNKVRVYFNKLITVLAAVLLLLCIVGTFLKSNAAPLPKIKARIEQVTNLNNQETKKVRRYYNGKWANARPYKDEKIELKYLSDSVQVPGPNDNQSNAKLAFYDLNGTFSQRVAQVNSTNKAWTNYIFPCTCKPGSMCTVGWGIQSSPAGGTTECQDWRVQSGSTTTNRIALPAAQRPAPNEINISKTREVLTLIQTKDLGNGNLAVDVLLGEVSIKQVNNQKEVPVEAGFRYTYFGGEKYDLDKIYVERILKSPSFEDFLNPKNWFSEEAATLIKDFRKAAGFAGSEGRNLSDLSVRLAAPTSAKAGSDIGSQIRVGVLNTGNSTAPGTESASSNGYMVDVMLSSDTNAPSNWAIYSPNYKEDVLLRGGRISNTKDLASQQREFYSTGGGIPADTPPGNYNICAKGDAGNQITESNEANNVSCAPIQITR